MEPKTPPWDVVEQLDPRARRAHSLEKPTLAPTQPNVSHANYFQAILGELREC